MPSWKGSGYQRMTGSTGGEQGLSEKLMLCSNQNSNKLQQNEEQDSVFPSEGEACSKT
jgi:hypothetical protein